MRIRENIHNLLLSFAMLSVAATYYWSVKYQLVINEPGSNELLNGEAITILYTSPLWIGLALYSLLSFNYLSKTKRIISVIPAILIWLPIILRYLSNAL
jgi:hypothetical protein